MDEPHAMSDISLLGLLKASGAGEVSNSAAEEFYLRYMDRLMSLVERNLAEKYRARFGPDDVVQTVFRTWFRRAQEGVVNPGTRDEVWKLLSTIALNKVRNKIKFHDAQKRSIGKTMTNEEVLAGVPNPTVQDAADFVDLLDVARDQLSENAQETLKMILEGNSNTEIADQLDRTTKSVTRYRHEIRDVLERLYLQAGGSAGDQNDA